MEDEVRRTWPRIPGSVVKSAGRVFQILEFFDNIRGSASATDVSAALGYPTSSTSILLRSMVKIGYVAYDSRHRTYHPTGRVRLLGNWIDEPLFGEGRLPIAIRDLNARTGNTTFVATRNGLSVQYIHVDQEQSTLGLRMNTGMQSPVATSTAGKVFLSRIPPAEVERLVWRINAERRPVEPLVDSKDLLAELAEIRATGVCVTYNSLVAPGTMVVAMPLPSKFSRPIMVMGVAGARDQMASQLDWIILAMKETIDNFY